MDLETILAGIGAILTAAGGCALVIREFRRRDRLSLKLEADQMSNDLAAVRADLLKARSYAFHIASLLTEHGVQPPDPPELSHRVDR